MSAYFRIAALERNLLLLAQKDVIPAKMVKLVSILIAAVAPDREIAVHPVFHPFSQQFDAGAQLIHRKVCGFLDAHRNRGKRLGCG